MAQSGFLQLNSNDDLSKVIKKCNTNFRALATQKQQQDHINAQAADETSEAIGEALSDIVAAIEDEAENRRLADEDLQDEIDTLGDDYVEKAGDKMTGDLDIMNHRIRAVSLNSNMKRDGSNPIAVSEPSAHYDIRDVEYQLLAQFTARRETDGTMEAVVRAYNDDSGTEVTEEFRVGIDRNGDAQYYLDTPSALLKALGLVTNVDNSTSYIGTSSSWTLWSAEKRRFGNVVTVLLQAYSSSALTAGTTYHVGNVPSAWRPANTINGTCSDGIAVLTDSGSFSVLPFRAVAANTILKIYFTFIV